MAIFNCFRMAAIRHLGFVMRNDKGHFVVFITVQNLVGINT